MKIASKIITILLFALTLFLGCEDDELDNPREATFTLFVLNDGNMFCNEAQLTFTFLITYPNGNQESITLAPSNEYQKTLALVRDNESINLKVFFASSENPLTEVNIPFIFNGVSDEALEPPVNELLVLYCHQDNSPLTWNTFY